jgi:hypothetical protein
VLTGPVLRKAIGEGRGRDEAKSLFPLTFLASIDHRRGWRFPTGRRILPCAGQQCASQARE